jgi:hypothetical protein
MVRQKEKHVSDDAPGEYNMWALALSCLRGLMAPGREFYRRVIIVLWLVIGVGLAYRVPFGEVIGLFTG